MARPGCGAAEDSSMSKSTVHLKVEFTIQEGKLDAFEALAQSMIAGSLKEPGTLGYDFYLSSDRKRCRLLETYADADAVLAHVTGPVVKELVPKLLGVSSLSGFEVFGDPGPKAAGILTGVGAEIVPAWHVLGR
jgi:quinol monooxygenase YgiN